MRDIASFRVEYSALLARYLARPEEAALVKAYELGREALTAGVGMLELIESHGAAVRERARNQSTGERAAAVADRALSLLVEVLAPYEIAYRGFSEANAALRQAHEESEYLSNAIWKASATLNLDECAGTLIRQALRRLCDACVLEIHDDLEGSARHEAFWVRKLKDSNQAGTGTHDSGGPTCLLATRLPVAVDGSRIIEREPFPGMRGDWIVHDLKGHRGSYGSIAFLKKDWTESKRRLIAAYVERAVTVIENAMLYRQAQKALVAREDMINVVSHDLKNPLTSIYLNSQILAKGLQENWKSATLDAPARRIGAAASRMRHLIDDILDMARVDTGRFVFNVKECAVGPLLEEAVQLMAPIAEQSQVRLVIQDECPKQSIRCDTDRVMQVFSNLIGNAIKFTPAGGFVAVRARLLGDSVLFSVQDTGTGIDPKDLPRIFDRLWQARPTASAGIGFGLFITRAIIEAHGGAICPDSAPGVGSTFFFTLPVEAAGTLKGSRAA